MDGTKWQRVDEENSVQEIRLPNPSARYFVIDSVQRKAYEEGRRRRFMERAREALEKVAAAVEAGRLKDPAKIGARAARAAAKHHSHRYYGYGVPGRGKFRFYEDPEKMQAEMLHGGKYILKTDDRIKAHIFVAPLALFLKRSLEHQLASTLPEASGSEAIAAMRSIGLAERNLNGQTTRLVSGGSRDARRVVRALGITNLTPPANGTGVSKAQEKPR